jgi:hypothetical protein
MSEGGSQQAKLTVMDSARITVIDKLLKKNRSRHDADSITLPNKQITHKISDAVTNTNTTDPEIADLRANLAIMDREMAVLNTERASILSAAAAKKRVQYNKEEEKNAKMLAVALRKSTKLVEKVEKQEADAAKGDARKSAMEAKNKTRELGVAESVEKLFQDRDVKWKKSLGKRPRVKTTERDINYWTDDMVKFNNDNLWRVVNGIAAWPDPPVDIYAECARADLCFQRGYFDAYQNMPVETSTMRNVRTSRLKIARTAFVKHKRATWVVTSGEKARTSGVDTAVAVRVAAIIESVLDLITTCDSYALEKFEKVLAHKLLFHGDSTDELKTYKPDMYKESGAFKQLVYLLRVLFMQAYSKFVEYDAMQDHANTASTYYFVVDQIAELSVIATHILMDVDSGILLDCPKIERCLNDTESDDDEEMDKRQENQGGNKEPMKYDTGTDEEEDGEQHGEIQDGSKTDHGIETESDDGDAKPDPPKKRPKRSMLNPLNWFHTPTNAYIMDAGIPSIENVE